MTTPQKPVTAPRRTVWALLAGIAMVAVVLSLVGVGITDGGPRTVSHFPEDGAVAVPASSPVFVVFDKPLGVDAGALVFSLQDSSGEPVPSSVKISDDSTAAELQPLSGLPPGDYAAAVEVPGVVEREEWRFTVPPPPQLTDGGGGPILLAHSDSDPVDDFYAETLRAEGFTSFTTVGGAELTPQLLAQHQLLLLSGDPGAGATSVVREWVTGGGRLVVVRPRGGLAELAGHGVVEGVRDGAHLQVEDRAWNGEQLRLHGDVDLLSVAADVATIASLTPESGGSEAVTVRDVGQGRVAAFTFDLGRTIVLTRQGNPAWAGEDRDDEAPVRTNDLFFGSAEDDTGGDFLDLDDVEVPHADELMRLLSRVIGDLTSERSPIPRFWYFPDDAEAVLVMAADDHGTPTGTRDFFERLLSLQADGCDVQAWECPRATSWMYTDTELSDAEAAAYVAQGFDIGAHVSTDCSTWSPDSLDRAFASGLEEFRRVFPSLPSQHGSRLHCIVWSDYVTQPVVEQAWGVRLDMSYYYWPGRWVRGRSGFMTGSGLPMRFADLDEGLIDVFQQPTHLVDEVFVRHPGAVDSLLARAQGRQEYYGAFGTHFDFTDSFASQVLRIARERDVPMISAEQLLQWTDGRYASRFEGITWESGVTRFDVIADARTHDGLRGMLPVLAQGGSLETLTRDGEPVKTSRRTVKGIEYAFFDATTGTYVATYRVGP